ncbi:DUF983 domain-containing protein [Paraflavisolibacter caeni]|uniref:DUF983 domain-containing protein n=1 Tax=Paraflavisolibacter caeni TaxID=2982496 RepID=UPI00311B0C61
MATDLKEGKPGFFNIFACKCPRCRRGDMFIDKNPWHLRNTMKMRKECPVCGQPFEPEVGFYFGAGYVSYALTVALCVATLVAWWVLIGFSFQDNRFFYWMIFNAVFLVALQPYLMRISRTGWLAFFTRYDPNWKNNPTQKVERDN